ncbi:hypothetical protein KCTC52924_03534 [Arenibacter antarcticus]|uniref:Conjugative transposon protein TraM n=1 Tax=Arenibacter antarcticus TaxID=2040469 RepID=A0ABW5VE72_9FLAO|nr:conjugative transposon protein TraM [Arenibacter sp. H213]MCM4166594.1 hypothetical protein [Arenibacter sp. H213]
MNYKIEKFNLWIKRHRLFAFSAPIILLLAVFFVMTSTSTMSIDKQYSIPEDAYNNTLPDHNKQLDVAKPNDIYKKSLKDSLDQLRSKGLFKSILETTKENDSLERILEELNNFSLSEKENNDTTRTKTISYSESNNSKTTATQEKLEYRNLLIQARDQRQARSQDYSAPYTEPSTTTNSDPISFDAAIYRDQFILPGNRVTLILKDDIHFKGRRFSKNTFVFATANVQGSRVLLEITNIDNTAMALTAIDQEDGMIGLHNERAGQLLQEFKADIQQQGVKELSEAVGEAIEIPLAQNLLRSFGNFFHKKKYKQRDKILLVNGDRVFLTQKKP